MPPPFRWVPFPLSAVRSVVLLSVMLFLIPACPEPSTHHEGFVESTNEGGSEKTEPTAEITPEESTNPEESATPEDGAPIEQEPIREEGPEPDIKETDKPYIERVNGNGPERPVNAAASPSKIDGLPAAPTKPSPSRIKDALVIEGNLLNQIDRWMLQSKDSKNTEQTWENQQIQKDSNMKHTLSLLGRNLVAGSFLLLGFSANTQVVSADVFILQGEKGDPGTQGTQGPKGDGFDQTTLDFVKSLQTTLKPDNAQKSIEITADTVTFKPATAGGKVTLKSGNATLDFAGDTITIKSTTFSLDTTTKIALKSPDVTVDSTTFEVKGPTNKVSFKVDDTNKKATFDSANVHVQSGLGATAPPGPMPNDPPRTNGLGNLIVGYNEQGSSAKNRTGSHNLILGIEHAYESIGSIISGKNHSIQSPHAAVIGGEENTIGTLGQGGVSIAGSGNKLGLIEESNHAANVAGQNNTASSNHAANVAGQNNTASGTHAATVGGGGVDPQNNARGNTAAQNHSVIVGGYKLNISKSATAATAACSAYNLTISTANTRTTCCVGTP